MTTSEMAEMRAFEALAKSDRLSDLVALVRALADPAVERRAADWRAPDEVKRLAAERKLDGPEEGALVKDLLRALEVGPASAEEHALARALYAHAVAEARPRGTHDEDRVAGACLWLAAHTPFDATRLLDRALGDDAAELWAAIADRVRGLEREDALPSARIEALLGAAALGGSASAAARKLARSLSGEVKDPALSRLLALPAPPAAPELTGQVLFAPRGAIAATLLAVSGVLAVLHLCRLFGRAALAYRTPAVVTVTEGGVRVRWRSEILGRKLRERDRVIGRDALACVTREVRYPRAALYGGLLFFTLGSFVGVRTLVDGVAAASPTLLLTGLAFVALGLLLDLGLATLAAGARGQSRLFIVPRRGRTLCLAEVDAERADSALAALVGPAA